MKTMKKCLALLLVVTMVLAMTNLAFAAPKKKYDGAFVKFTGNAYGYKKAGSNRSDVIVKKGSHTWSIKSEIKNGKEWVLIQVDQCKYTWLWFSADYLTKYSGTDELIVFAGGGDGRSETDGKTKKIDSSKYKRVKATGNVYIRKNASLSGKACGVLYKGETLKLAKDYVMKRDSRGVWFYHVRHWYKGKQGNYWVSKAYTKLIG